MASIYQAAPLGDIARIFSGGPAPQGAPFFAPDGPPFVRVRDLGAHGRTDNLTDIRDKLSPKALDECPLVLARKGTVVLPKSGAAILTNTRAMLGADAYIVGHLLALEAKPEFVIPEWIYHAMCSIDMAEHIVNPSYPSLQKSAVEKIKIPLPSLAEQKRIVHALSAQLRRAAKMKAAMQAQSEAIAVLPRSILAAAAFAREQQPQEWEVVPLEELCGIVTGKTPARSDHAAFAGDNPWVKIGDMDGAEKVIRSGEKLTDEAVKKYNCRLVAPGTVLLSFKLSIGKVAFAGIPLYTNEAIAALPIRDSAKKRITPAYLYWALRGIPLDRDAGTAAKGKTLNKRKLEKIGIPLPPLSQQRIIAGMLAKKMRIVARLQTAAEAQLDAAAALPGACLRAAFSL